MASRLICGVCVSLPDTTILQQGVLEYPVIVAPKNEADSLIAYQFECVYDTVYMDFVGVSVQGTFTETWRQPLIHENHPGVVSVVGFTTQPDSIQLDDTSHVLLYLQLEPHCAHSQIIPFKLANIRFFSVSGDIGDNSEHTAFLEIIVNYPPQIRAFPVLQVLEDAPFIIHLDELISDMNDSLESLDITLCSDTHFSFDFDTISLVVTIQPALDWYGESALQIQVEDPFGDVANGAAPFHVIAQNDVPGSFHLNEPENHAVLTTSEINFQWQQSENVDPDDEIRYRFFLSPDSLFLAGNSFQIPNIQQSSLGWQNPLTPGTYYWKVVAYDSEGLMVLCQQIYSFTVPQQSDVQNDFKAGSFQIYSIAPNPCNPGTTIVFSIPGSGSVETEVINMTGRRVRTLFSGRLNAGEHRLAWNGLDNQQQSIASGRYIIRIMFGQRSLQKTVIVCQ